MLGQRVNVQLWDCGGGIQFEPLWPVMAKGLEGVIMVYDGKKQEQEKELERIYVKYAQPARLNITQVRLSLSILLHFAQGFIKRIHNLFVNFYLF